MKKSKRNNDNIKGRKNIDKDLIDYLEMSYEGISQLEIARELGINSKYVDKLIEEIEKDY